jgi:hypothetical protein
VAQQPGALDAEHVEQRDGVVGHPRLAEVAVGGLARPPEAAKVHREQAELAEQGDEPPPRVPVLGEPVQGEQRRAVLGPGVRHVDRDPGREVVEAMLDPLQDGRLHTPSVRGH